MNDELRLLAGDFIALSIIFLAIALPAALAGAYFGVFLGRVRHGAVAGLVVGAIAFGLLNAWVYLDAELDPWACNLDLASELRRRTEPTLRLRDLTTFQWTELRIFAEYDSGDDVRALGIEYDHENVPESAAELVFLSDGTPICRHTWYWSGTRYNFHRGFDPTDPLMFREPHSP